MFLHLFIVAIMLFFTGANAMERVDECQRDRMLILDCLEKKIASLKKSVGDNFLTAATLRELSSSDANKIEDALWFIVMDAFYNNAVTEARTAVSNAADIVGKDFEILAPNATQFLRDAPPLGAADPQARSTSLKNEFKLAATKKVTESHCCKVYEMGLGIAPQIHYNACLYARSTISANKIGVAQKQKGKYVDNFDRSYAQGYKKAYEGSLAILRGVLETYAQKLDEAAHLALTAQSPDNNICDDSSSSYDIAATLFSRILKDAKHDLGLAGRQALSAAEYLILSNFIENFEELIGNVPARVIDRLIARPRQVSDLCELPIATYLNKESEEYLAIWGFHPVLFEVAKLWILDQHNPAGYLSTAFREEQGALKDIRKNITALLALYLRIRKK